MEQNPSNTNIEQILANMLTETGSEVPMHLNHDEEAMLDVFLGFSKFETLPELLNDIEDFLKEELDLKSITRENVGQINFSALATQFGKRYGLAELKKLTINKAKELTELGWKSTRTILVKVLLPQLQEVAFSDAQFFVLTLEDFITKYAIIQGENPEFVFDQLRYWDIFKDYQFTLELDNGEPERRKELPPPDEFIRWAGRNYTVEQAGEDLEKKYKLIVDKEEWILFFEDHEHQISVVPGQLNKLVTVLHQMEYNCLFDKSKKKGCWKIWQLILVDEKGELFKKKLRQTSSKIKKESTQRDQEDYEFGKNVIKEMMQIEKDNSVTI